MGVHMAMKFAVILTKNAKNGKNINETIDLDERKG